MLGQAALTAWWPPLSMPVSGQAALTSQRPPINASVRTGRPDWLTASVILCLVHGRFHSAPKLSPLPAPTRQPVSRPAAGSHLELILLDPEFIFCGVFWELLVFFPPLK